MVYKRKRQNTQVCYCNYNHLIAKLAMQLSDEFGGAVDGNCSHCTATINGTY